MSRLAHSGRIRSFYCGFPGLFGFIPEMIDGKMRSQLDNLTERLVDLLREARPMPRLVVLNSCSGAATGGERTCSPAPLPHSCVAG